MSTHRGLFPPWLKRTAQTPTAIVLALTCLAIGPVVSLLLGQDVNWDLRNYHLAGPHAVFEHRIDRDLDPAGVQSYLNPTLDLAYYALARGPLAEHPRLLAVFMGLPYGAMIFATLCLSHRLVAPSLSGRARAAAVGVSTAAAVTGAGSLAQAGTVFNEVTIAMLVLFGVYLALPGPASAIAKPCWARLLGSGLFLGLATGLKLTAGIFAPALVLALLATAPRARWFPTAAAMTALFCAGWGIGFAASAGWWATIVYAKFGNPVFPLFNAYFKSPWYPEVNFRDLRFLPKTTLQWFFYPAWWATWSGQVVNAELPYSDPRLLLALITAAAAGAVRLLVSFAPHRLVSSLRFSAVEAFLLVFWVIGYALWLSGSAIIRYGVVLEVLGFLLFSTAIIRVGKALSPGTDDLAVAYAAVAALACMTSTQVPDYGRVAYGPRVFDVDVSWVPVDTLFVAITGPTAYVPTFVPAAANATVVGFSFINPVVRDFPLTTRSAAMVRDHHGPVIALLPGSDRSMVPYFPLIGLSPDLGPCRPIHSNLDQDGVMACAVKRLDRE